MPHQTCIIVGAGLAGLAAAYSLKKRRWKVTVLEAQLQPGGRVLSYRFKDYPHLVCELGGEWIGQDHKQVRGLCKEFGLKLVRHQYSYSFWNGRKRSPIFKPGQWCFSQKARQKFQRFARNFEKLDPAQTRALDQFDWWNTLRTFGFTDDELLQRDLMDSTDFGETIRLTSAYTAAAEYIESNPTDEMDSKIRGGNDQLVFSMVDAIGPNQVYMGNRVKSIHQTKHGVEVRVAGKHRVFRAEYCICTIPASCLLRISWSPALPQEQIDAARQLQYSRIMKTAVLFNKRFWRNGRESSGFSAFTSRVSDFCFDSTYRQKGPGGILCSYSIGDKADDLAAEHDEAKFKKWIREDMLEVTGADDRGVEAIHAFPKAWQKVHWIGGAYAFYRPGQWFSIRPLLQRSHGRVLFAGEHLADLQGFMEGAVVTGQAAADQL